MSDREEMEVGGKLHHLIKHADLRFMRCTSQPSKLLFGAMQIEHISAVCPDWIS